MTVIQRTDEQADRDVEVEVGSEMAGLHAAGERLPQAFPPRFDQALPEVFEEFGVAAVLGEDRAE
ncbi:MAG TPA: hypothetical protein VK162_01805, partial [Streptosporangiaceae bacterium]|nr:hypothetical protein [Streptosporangiaceae bacterium]